MEVTFFSFAKSSGGAAKAAERMLNSVANLGVKTKTVVIKKSHNTHDKDVLMPGVIERSFHFICWCVSYILARLFISNLPAKQSLNIFGSQFVRRQLKKSQINHIHWINNEMIKIKDFHFLSRKSVVTLHDEWFYCGTEHYSFDNSKKSRKVEGYHKYNKNVLFFDLPKYIWNLKKNNYDRMSGVIFTVPSKWMYEQAKSSYLLKNMDVRVVSNPLNTDIFKKKEDLSSKTNNNQDNSFTILYSLGRIKDSYTKGLDLFVAALHSLKKQQMSDKKIKILICGERFPVEELPFEAEHLGFIETTDELVEIYNKADITVFPSRRESFGQVAAESLSCETPVVAFNHSGVTDIVLHEKNGYLAKPFDTNSLCDGINYFLKMKKETLQMLGKNGRDHIVQNMSTSVVGSQLVEIYKELDKKRIEAYSQNVNPPKHVSSGITAN